MSITNYTIVNKICQGEKFIPRGGARPGAGRPTLYPKTKRLSIRLAEHEIEMLDKCVEITGTNRSDIMSKGIVEILKKLTHNQ